MLILTICLIGCQSVPLNVSESKALKNWKVYQTVINEYVLEVSFPGAVNTDDPTIQFPASSIDTDLIDDEFESSELIFNLDWKFKASRFKHVDAHFTSFASVVRVVDHVEFKGSIKSLNGFKEYITQWAVQDWERRNKKIQATADYFSPLKFYEPKDFEEVYMNGTKWFKYVDVYTNYIHPLNDQYYIAYTSVTSHATANRGFDETIEALKTGILGSLKITQWATN